MVLRGIRPWAAAGAALILGPLFGWYVEAPRPRMPLRLVRLQREVPVVPYVLRAAGQNPSVTP